MAQSKRLTLGDGERRRVEEQGAVEGGTFPSSGRVTAEQEERNGICIRARFVIGIKDPRSPTCANCQSCSSTI